MTPIELQEYISRTYFQLRTGLCILAFLFPILLFGVGLFNDIPLQGSMSAYYYAFAPQDSPLRIFPGRVVFVGILFALGFFLILYKGFSKTENWALNVAGACALLVALFPMETPKYCTNCGSDPYSFLHGIAAVVLFLCIAFVAWACSEETLVQLPGPSRDWFRARYTLLALAMTIAPLAAFVMTFLLGIFDKWTFFVEWFGIAMFSIYWGLKSYELRLSKADTGAMMGEKPAVDVTSAERNSLRMRAGRLLD
jgi:hypothetical protein